MISIAPMIAWTDRNYRFLMRQITKETQLYTEMVGDNALLHNLDNLERFLGSSSIESPLAVQLGGCDVETLGEAAAICETYGGFNEINLNCGCPSNKAVRSGFGAELMHDSELVRKIVYEMKRKTSHTDITVKCRLGTDQKNGWDNLTEFVMACKAGGVTKMIVHARICVLNGLSPAQNRSIPELNYDTVHKLVKTFPDMTFILNGGLKTFQDIDQNLGRNGGVVTENCLSGDETQYVCNDDVTVGNGGAVSQEVLGQGGGRSRSCSRSAEQEEYVCSIDHCMDFLPPVHGVMVGREAYTNPWCMANVDRYFYGKPNPGLTRREALDKYLDYCQSMIDEGAADRDRDGGQAQAQMSLSPFIHPLHNYFCGCDGNKLYKRKLDSAVIKFNQLHNRRVKSLVALDYQGEIMRDILCEALVDTIPDCFLDQCMGPDGVMVLR